MEIDGLRLPELLTSMIASGRWPSTSDSFSAQNLRSWIPDHVNRKLQGICLYPPPFRTLASCQDDPFYRDFGAIWQLKPEQAIAIADFGIGADSPILLYYENGTTEPVVLKLEWQAAEGSNSWLVMSPSFAAFVDMLGI